MVTVNADQASNAIAAHIVNGDEDLARSLAAALPYEQLVELVLKLSRVNGFGMVESFQRAGLSADDAKRMAVDYFRRFAGFEILREEGDEKP
jgi:hypothetical protein